MTFRGSLPPGTYFVVGISPGMMEADFFIRAASDDDNFSMIRNKY